MAERPCRSLYGLPPTGKPISVQSRVNVDGVEEKTAAAQRQNLTRGEIVDVNLCMKLHTRVCSQRLETASDDAAACVVLATRRHLPLVTFSFPLTDSP